MGILDILKLRSKPQTLTDGTNPEIDSQFTELNKQDANRKSETLINNFKLKKFKIGLLKQIFQMMRKMGIDPNDIDQVSEFTQKLAEQDPDLLKIFEDAMNTLMPESLTPGQGPSLMGQKTTNLQEGMMQPRTNLPEVSTPNITLPETSTLGMTPIIVRAFTLLLIS